MFLLLLFLVSMSLAVCPTGGVLPALELTAQTVDKQGKFYRRADVLVFIPVEKKLLSKEVNRLQSLSEIVEEEEGLFGVNVKIKNVSNSIVEGAYVEQPLGKGSELVGSIRAKKVISKFPLIVEPLSLYPTDLTKDKAVIKLPSLKPGEELELMYSVRGALDKPAKPVVKRGGTYTTNSEDRLYMLVAKYSVLFGYGKTKTKDPNLENLKELIEGFRIAGLRPVIRVVGVADGKTKNPGRNLRVAQSRAHFIAREVFGEDYACYVRKVYAGTIR